MRKSIIALCLCCLLTSISFAQEYRQMKWVLKANMGYSVPVMKFPSGGHITDNLLGNIYNNTYFQFPAITFYINNNWGIEFSGAAYISNYSDKYKEKVHSFISDYCCPLKLFKLI